MDNNTNPKCNSCYCYWKPDETDVKSSGLVFKTCKRCRDKVKEHRENNPDKIKKYKKKWYENNTDKVKENCKKYCEQNPDKVKEYQKEWRENNADKLKEYYKEWYEMNKCEHDKSYGYCKLCNLPLYLINIQRHQINRCFKLSSENKTKSSIEYLGCDAEYFIEYFEKKMNIWNQNNDIKMDWDNIHIDHIKPVSSFDLDNEDDFLDCCHYSNLQPLLSTDNLSKGRKWSDDYDVYWNNNIKGKEHLQIYIPMV